MHLLTKLLPLFLCLTTVFFVNQSLSVTPEHQPQALVGKPLPAFTLPNLENNRTITAKDLTDSGEITLLNVWATWCDYCEYEHPYLMDLAEKDDLKLYGLNYKDNTKAAKTWLRHYDNPYVQTIVDNTGSMGQALGVYTAPETILLDHNGIIRKRFAGPIGKKIWRREFAPLIAQIKAEREKEKQGS